MTEKLDYQTYQNNDVSVEHYPGKIQKKRNKCVICNLQIDEKDESIFSKFNCNVRAFKK